MNLYKITTIGLIVGAFVACGAAGSDPTSVAHADEGAAGNSGDCTCEGQAGPQGAPGPQGPAGPAGKDAVCASGMSQCPAVVQGPVGADGAKGADGSSCSAIGGGDTVQIACSNGTMATLAAPSGLKGEKGEPGTKGDTGSQGLPGEQGSPGKDGKDGVSITKNNLYVRYGLIAQAGVIARCDDINDVVITGGCDGGVPFKASVPVWFNDETTAAGWQCVPLNQFQPNDFLRATAVCLEVP